MEGSTAKMSHHDLLGQRVQIEATNRQHERSNERYSAKHRLGGSSIQGSQSGPEDS